MFVHEMILPSSGIPKVRLNRMTLKVTYQLDASISTESM